MISKESVSRIVSGDGVLVNLPKGPSSTKYNTMK